MKKETMNLPGRREPTIEEMVDSTIALMKNCPREIKEQDLQGFLSQKQWCDDFLEKGIVNRMMEIKAQMQMMSMKEYCTIQLTYSKAIIEYLENELAK